MGGGYVFKACRSSAECAPSMVCLGDRCSCPLGYGIDHPPDCQHRTPVREGGREGPAAKPASQDRLPLSESDG